MVLQGISYGLKQSRKEYKKRAYHRSLSFTLKKIQPAIKATSRIMPTTDQKFHQKGVLAVSVQCQAITAVKAATTTIPVTIQSFGCF
jgi:hypothetical protein